MPFSLYVEPSSLDGLLFAGQNYRVELRAARSHASSFSVTAIPQEMSADYIFHILLGDSLIFGVIDELRSG